MAVVVITGAAGGLGKAFAGRLSKDGHRLALIDIDEPATTSFAQTLPDARAFSADLTNKPAIDSAMEAVATALGPIDYLCNNAGGVCFRPGPAEEIGLEDWNRALALNLTSAWLCTQAVIPDMKARRSGGIVNIATTMAMEGRPVHLAPYVAAKGGLIALTRALARELGSSSITVNAVAPGVIPHKIAQGAPLPDFVERVIGEQSLSRVGAPDDVSGIIAFLCSGEARFITGQVLNVDGGWSFG
jgi:NAD(P)-dependent dehydrogenase (short-subunit alcohol dehydrogenase family)